MRVIGISNQKGGVGKTTTTVALSGLALSQGSRVLMVDLDPHGSLSSYFGLDPDRQERSVYTLFKERTHLSATLMKELILPTQFPWLDLLPSSTALATLERQSIGQDAMGLVLAKSLAMVYDEYDYVFLDTPPILGVLLVNALAACQHLVIPVQTEFLALKGLERMVHTLRMLTRSRKKSLEYTIVPVMYDRRTQASVTTLRAIRNGYGEEVWPGCIPVDTKFRDASKAGMLPHLFDADTHGVEAYKSLYTFLARKLDTETARKHAGGQ